MKKGLAPLTNLLKRNRVAANLTIVLFTVIANLGGASAQQPETFQKTKSATISPEMLSASFAEVAKRVEPAVVNIDTKGKVPEIKLRGSDPAGDDDVLDYFRRNLPRRPNYAVGSGFIVDRTGYIMTNYHVVQDSARITVRLRNGEEYTAVIVGADDLTDLAVLKIEADKDLPYLRFGDSESIRIGDWVLAVGSPFGLEQTVTAGIISQTKRETPAGTAFQKFIQTDAAINRGNSGGPLVNMYGDVIGVNSQIATSTGDYNGIGFALPSSEANYVFEQILRNGKVRRGFLGVFLDSVKKEFAQVYRLPEAKGAIITQIRDQSGAAAKAGLLKDDIVIALDGIPVENHQDLISRVASVVPGNEVAVTVLRESGKNLERKTIKVVLDERPNNDVVSDDGTKRILQVDPTGAEPPPFIGLTVADIDVQSRRRLRGNKGVLIKKIDPASYFADLKNSSGGDALEEGDLIQRLNRTPVENLEGFNKLAAVLEVGSPVVLHILKYDRNRRQFNAMVVQFTVK